MTDLKRYCAILLGFAAALPARADTSGEISKSEAALAAPVVVIDRDQIVASGLLSVGDILQDLPSQLNSINTQFNNGGDGATRVDLRGLGTTRTLVLLNGRRVVNGGTGADSSVDLNLIPLAMVSRIEVLKHGASAAHGSGAIAGVVNIVTRDDLRGPEGDIYIGSSGESDGTTYGLSLLFGGGDDSSGFLLGASYAQREAAWTRDRGFSAVDRFYDYESDEVFELGSSAVPNGALLRFDDEFDPGNALYQSEVVANCPSGFCTRDDDGIWRDLDPDSDFYNYQDRNYLVTPGEQYALFGSTRKDLGGVRIFADLNYSHRKSDQRLAPTPLFEFENVISRDSLYNPYGLDLFLRRRMVEAGDRRQEQDIDMMRLAAGVGGDLPGDRGWSWEVAVYHGRVTADQVNRGDLHLGRLNAASGPSFLDEGGTPRCGVQGPDAGPEDDIVVAGCVPVNLPGLPGSVTPAMLDYIGVSPRMRGENGEIGATARIEGDLLEAPGRLSAVFGLEVRSISGEFLPDADTASGQTTGSFILPTEGSYSLNEAFAELHFTPVTGGDWTRSLEFDAAVRAYDGGSAISGTAIDTGFRWQMRGGLTLRGTWSNAYRVPTIDERFSLAMLGFDFAQDPCDAFVGSLDDPNVASRCAAEGLPTDFESNLFFIVPALRGGNADAREERADTFTVGLLVEPAAFPGLSVGVDYFEIIVKDAITSIFSGQVFANCYFNADADRRNCDLVSRDPGTGFINFVDTRIGNHGRLRTSGYDAAFRFTRDLGGTGRFSLAIDLTYLESFEDGASGFVTEGVGVYDLSGVYPRLKTQSSLRWDRGALGLGLNLRSVSGFTECEFFACFDPFVRENLSREVSDYWAADLFGSWRTRLFSGESTLRIGVNNLADEDPPVIYDGFLADSDAATYDYLGRYFYASLTQKF